MAVFATRSQLNGEGQIRAGAYQIYYMETLYRSKNLLCEPILRQANEYLIRNYTSD